MWTGALSQALKEFPNNCDGAKISLVDRGITEIDAISSQYQNVEVLYLSNNLIHDVSGLLQFKRLKTLSLTANPISSLNHVVSVLSAKPSHFREIKALSLDGTRVSYWPFYRACIIVLLPKLMMFDRRSVSDKERHLAQKYAPRPSILADIGLALLLGTFVRKISSSADPLISALALTLALESASGLRSNVGEMLGHYASLLLKKSVEFNNTATISNPLLAFKLSSKVSEGYDMSCTDSYMKLLLVLLREAKLPANQAKKDHHKEKANKLLIHAELMNWIEESRTALLQAKLETSLLSSSIAVSKITKAVDHDIDLNRLDDFSIIHFISISDIMELHVQALAYLDTLVSSGTRLQEIMSEARNKCPNVLLDEASTLHSLMQHDGLESALVSNNLAFVLIGNCIEEKLACFIQSPFMRQHFTSTLSYSSESLASDTSNIIPERPPVPVPTINVNQFKREAHSDVDMLYEYKLLKRYFRALLIARNIHSIQRTTTFRYFKMWHELCRLTLNHDYIAMIKEHRIQGECFHAMRTRACQLEEQFISCSYQFTTRLLKRYYKTWNGTCLLKVDRRTSRLSENIERASAFYRNHLQRFKLVLFKQMLQRYSSIKHAKLACEMLLRQKEKGALVKYFSHILSAYTLSRLNARRMDVISRLAMVHKYNDKRSRLSDNAYVRRYAFTQWLAHTRIIMMRRRSEEYFLRIIDAQKRRMLLLDMFAKMRAKAVRLRTTLKQYQDNKRRTLFSNVLDLLRRQYHAHQRTQYLMRSMDFLSGTSISVRAGTKRIERYILSVHFLKWKQRREYYSRRRQTALFILRLRQEKAKKSCFVTWYVKMVRSLYAVPASLKADFNNRINNLTEWNEELKSHNSKLKGKITDLTYQLNQLEIANGNYASKNEMLKVEMVNTETKYSRLVNELQKLKIDMAAMEESKEKTRKQMASLSNKLGFYESQMDHNMKSQQETTSGYLSEINKLKLEAERLQKRLEDEETCHRVELAKAQTEVKVLATKLEIANGEVEKLKAVQKEKEQEAPALIEIGESPYRLVPTKIDWSFDGVE